MKLAYLVLPLSILLAGCPKDAPPPSEFCDQLASELCVRIYECATAEELAAAGLPSSESACEVQLQAAQGCSAKTTSNACTEGNETYHGGEAATCLTQIDGLNCSEVVGAADLGLADAPACGKVCAIDGN